MTREKSAWEKLPNDKKRSMQQQAEDLVSGSIIESAAARFIAMLICEAAEVATQNERCKWLDAIAAWNRRALPVAEPVSDRDAIRPHLIAERMRWWSPEYPGQTPPTLAVWWRDEPEDGLSGFDTRQDRDAFLRGEPGPFIRRVTGNEFPQLPCADNRAIVAERQKRTHVGGEASVAVCPICDIAGCYHIRAAALDVSETPESDRQTDLLPASERQEVRDRALDDAARAASDRAAYWWNEATAADDAGRKKLSLSYEAKALACTELAAAIRAMKGTKA